MSKRNILVVTNAKEGSYALADWTSSSHPFHVNIVENDEQAIQLFQREHFDIVLIDDTDNSINGKKLFAVLPILQGDATILRYQGETVKQLKDNVEAVLSAKRYQRVQRMMMLEPDIRPKNELPPFSLN